MNAECTKLNSYQKKVSFQISVEEMALYREKAFNKFRQKAAIPGFRKGKAPASLINTRYSAVIDQETVDLAINETYTTYLKANKIWPLSPADIQDVSFGAEKPFSYSAVVEVQPEVEVEKYAGFEAEQLIVKVDEAEMAQAEKELLNRYASVKEVDSAVVSGNIVRFEARTAGLADVAPTVHEVETGDAEGALLTPLFVGKNKGETVTATLTFPADYQVKALADSSDELEYKVIAISEKKVPELTDEFAATIDKKYTTAQELKAEIEKGLTEYKTRQSENTLFNTLINQIVDANNSFEVPPTILDDYLTNLAENAKKQYGFKGIENSVLKDLYRDNAAKSLKWEYLKQAIITAEKLSVTEEDVEAKLTTIAAEAKIELDKVKQYYAGEQKENSLKQDILEEKLKAVLIAKNNVIMVEKLTNEEQTEEQQ